MAKKDSINTPASRQRSKPFPIVAIGASAGGIEAVTELLRNLSPDTGMAYVYIQHLDPAHESMLGSILSRATKMKVVEAEESMPIQPNHVYVIPPNKGLSISDGVLTLNPRRPRPSPHMPVDQFFTSLAEKQKDGAIGIVLSGTAHDGTIGLKAIKFAGGLTFAQDESARFQSMPMSAIAEGAVDLVLPPAGIAKELERLAGQANVMQEVMTETADDIVDNDGNLLQILDLLKKSVGVDFRHYKMKTIKRRVIRRMLLYKLNTLEEYLQYIRQHPAEINLLYNDFLINVTSFFRDPDTMEHIRATIIPALLKNKRAGEPVRVWVPACSTGEEAYSLAMLFMEELAEKGSNIQVQIFATDLSETALAKARVGLYSRNDVAEVSPKRLQRFFTKVDGSYRIIKSIRDLCVFAPHNIFKDPPFSRLDLVSCCNLMIYLDTVLQRKVLGIFYYALNTDGYLVLGKSETSGASGHLFSQPEKKYKIFTRNKDVSGRPLVNLHYNVVDLEQKKDPSFRNMVPKETDYGIELEEAVDKILLTKFVPASVVVNADLEILHFRGSTGLFLEPSPGKASLNLLRMARGGLAFELKSAVHKANKSGEPFKKTGLEIKHNGNTRRVSIEVVPLKTDSQERLFLVVFQDLPDTAEKPSAATKDKLVKQLQEELTALREDMRSMIEEQEASNEELQSANEEIVSSNEELQSINEELETSKEELESTNEELMTINTELQVRNEQLAESYEYAETIFSIISEAVLILDNELRVKSANRTFYRMFQVKEDETDGMLVYELGSRQWDIPKLRELLEDIIPRNSEFYGFEVRHVFPHIGEKVMLLNARKVQKSHRQKVIFLTIQDITEITHLREKIKRGQP